MAIATRTVRETAEAAAAAARVVARAGREQKDAALRACASALGARQEEILEANRADLDAGREAGLTEALIDRLTLSAERIGAMAQGLEAVAGLEDPVGEELETRTLARGMRLRKRRIPLGVVAIVYEARPNVTVDSAALCLKSGNAVLLRGSRSAANSNAVLAAIFGEAVEGAGLPPDAVALIGGEGHDDLRELATLDGVVDLVIPRGGEGLKAALEEVATVPVLYAASGNCHVYVDASADARKALAIAVDAKVDRPGVCNAAETLLVHEAVADEFLPRVADAMAAEGVELVGDERTRSLVAGVGVGEATDHDWDAEYLALKLAVRVVGSLEEAVGHVNRHGSGHSEAIVTEDEDAAARFADGVTSACVYVNASTRFTDGFEYGMGAEIGNSTQKLHARGPIGLRELTTYQYVVWGDGQTKGSR